jgi:hypothetical protein
MLTGDSLFAMAGSLVVLCGGALFAGEGAIGEVLGNGFSYPYFPGFRRYLPAMAFPPFFLLLGLVWKTFNKKLSSESDTNVVTPDRSAFSDPWLIVLAVLAFGYTVYSYFFVWTAAAAWLGSLALLCLIGRPTGVRKDLSKFIGLGLGCSVLLVPYFYLLSLRATTLDDVQMLVHTHMPDISRTPFKISVLVLAVLVVGAVFKLFSVRDKAVLFAASLALTQIIVFNQQVVTGRSLQPIHYQVFIGNYVAGLSVVVTLGLLWRSAGSRQTFLARASVAALALLAVVWGFVECHYTVRVLDEANVIRDESLPVEKRLASIAKDEPEDARGVVLNLGLAESDDLPTVAPQPVLWARHQHVFAGVSTQENKERYYQYLYYTGVQPRQLADGIKSGNDFVSMIALFGWGRHTDRLNADYKPLTFGEIDMETARYADYVNRFAAPREDVVPVRFLITPADPNVDLENIDRWYVRDAGEVWGNYVLYRLQTK